MIKMRMIKKTNEIVTRKKIEVVFNQVLNGKFHCHHGHSQWEKRWIFDMVHYTPIFLDWKEKCKEVLE